MELSKLFRSTYFPALLSSNEMSFGRNRFRKQCVLSSPKDSNLHFPAFQETSQPWKINFLFCTQTKKIPSKAQLLLFFANWSKNVFTRAIVPILACMCTVAALSRESTLYWSISRLIGQILINSSQMFNETEWWTCLPSGNNSANEQSIIKIGLMTDVLSNRDHRHPPLKVCERTCR